MAFNINEIKSQLTYGGARPNLFQVRIDTKDNTANIKVPFMVQAAQIPSSNLGTIRVPYFGRQLKLAGDRTFEPWTVNVINDEDFKVRNAMETWSNQINRHQANIRSLNAYKSDATVIQYGKDGSVLREYRFVGIYPSVISPIELSWGDVDNYQSFQVQFEYDFWEVVGGNTGNAGGS